MLQSNRSRRSYDLVSQFASITITALMAANAILQPKQTLGDLVYFFFMLLRSIVVVSLISKSSPWFHRHRRIIFNWSQILTGIFYFAFVMKTPQMAIYGPDKAGVPNTLPPSGRGRARFLLLVPMLQLNVSSPQQP